LGRQLAEFDMQRRAYAASIEHTKSVITQWYRFRLDELTPGDWQHLFPMPYSSEIRSAGRRYRVSPYLIAGLIRQESEFDTTSISAAHAHGLMQVEPHTARYHRRQLRRRRITPADLLSPSINIRVGTAELKDLVGHYSSLEYALAAYNAGGSRVSSWLAQGTITEPAAFVESIPFSETQAYVQAVMRNARVYRTLYGGTEAR
jgi:soluble lytic murein transglycosylase